MPEETQLKDGLRQAMRRLTSAVCVISTAHGGQRFGMTATSVTALSLAPPALLACINRAARLHDPLICRQAFCVNILNANDSEIAETFSGACGAERRFECGAWAETEDGVPHLLSAQANVFCELDAVSSYGTHSIVIGKVKEVRLHGNVSPLLYQDGKYTVGLGEGVDWIVPVA